jgi:hypothetical protein
MNIAGNIHSLVDIDAPPYVPPGWSVQSHRSGPPVLNFNDRFGFYLAREQQNGSVQGYELRKTLEGKPVVNANVLDFLLKKLVIDPRYLSDRWKYDMHDHPRYVFFWGTIYIHDGEPLVRCLHWDNFRWASSYGWLSSQWNSYYQALTYL